MAGSAGYEVSHMEGSLLYEDCRHGTASLVKLGLDDHSSGLSLCVCLELHDIRCEGYHLQQIVNARSCLCGNRHKYRAAAPFLGNELVFRKLLLHAVGICTGLIYLVYCNDYLNICGLCMVYGLYRLGHDAVVSRNNEDHDIGGIGTSHTHRREGLMSGGVKEGYLPALDADRIGSYGLGNAACLLFGDVALSYGIKQRGLAVVDVTHDADYRRTLFHGALILFILFEELCNDVYRLFMLTDDVVVYGDILGFLVADLGVYRHYLPRKEELFDYHGGLQSHVICKFLDGQRVGNSYDLDLLLHRLCHGCRLFEAVRIGSLSLLFLIGDVNDLVLSALLVGYSPSVAVGSAFLFIKVFTFSLIWRFSTRP